MTAREGPVTFDPAALRARAGELDRIAEAAAQVAARIDVRWVSGGLGSGDPSIGPTIREMGRAHATAARALHLYAAQLEAARHRLGVVDELLVAAERVLAADELAAGVQAARTGHRDEEADGDPALAAANARVSAERAQVARLQEMGGSLRADVVDAAARCEAALTRAMPDAATATATVKAVDGALTAVRSALLQLAEAEESGGRLP